MWSRGSFYLISIPAKWDTVTSFHALSKKARSSNYKKEAAANKKEKMAQKKNLLNMLILSLMLEVETYH